MVHPQYEHPTTPSPRLDSPRWEEINLKQWQGESGGGTQWVRRMPGHRLEP
jgi:hypothetical protein